MSQGGSGHSAGWYSDVAGLMVPRNLHVIAGMADVILAVAFKTILITGGCGFLGQHLTGALLEAFPGQRIRAMDLKPNPCPHFNFSTDERVETRLGLDICQLEAIRGAFAGADVVIHLAGLVSPALTDRDALERVNVVGTRNVLQVAREQGVTLFVHISSVAARGYNNDPHHPADETFQFDWSIARKKHKYYMLTKHLADKEVEACRRDGLEAVILYPGLMFGPGDHRNTAKIIRAIGGGKVLACPPGGTNVVDVRDVARGIVDVLRQNIRTGNYMLSGWNRTFREIFSTIAEATGGRAPLFALPRFLLPVIYPVLLTAEAATHKRLGLSASDLDSSFQFRYFDHSRAKDTFGWSPAIPFSQTIADTIVWMRAHGLA